MNHIKKMLLSRVVPTTLIVVLVLNLMPLPNNYVYATEVEEISNDQIEGVTVTAYTGNYDENEHEAITITGILSGDIVEYKLGDGSWSTEVPKVKTAGNYTINVRVSRTDFETLEISKQAIVSKAPQTFCFNHYSGDNSTDTIVGQFTNKTYDFSARDDEKKANGTITYKLELTDENTGIATIDENTGILTVTDAGTITVAATLSGNDNYAETTIRHSLVVTIEADAKGQFIYFENALVSYVLGENNGIASSQTIKRNYSRDKGTVTYSLDKENIGLTCDENTGEITVSDYDLLSQEMINGDGIVAVVITANKAQNRLYGSDTVSYTLSISFLEMPAETYEMSGTKGENDWYVNNIVLTPKDSNYTIAKICDASAFATSVEVSDIDGGYVYLRSNLTGGITSRISYGEIKMDTTAPLMTVTCNDPGAIVDGIHYYSKDIEGTISIEEKNFVPENVIITVTKSGETPYTVSATWTSQENVHTGKFVISVLNIDGVEGDYTFLVTCKDDAGNVVASDYTSETMRVDTKKPEVTISYSNPNAIHTTQDREGNIRQYFNDVQTTTITVADEFLDISDTSIVITAKDAAGNDLDQSTTVSQTEWTQEGNLYTKTISFTGEANYKIQITSLDWADNTSDVLHCFTVDKTPPTNLSIQYSTSVFETILEAVTFGFYNAKTQVTITAEDSISGIYNFSYSYIKAAGVSDINTQVVNQIIPASNIEIAANGKTATARFEVPSGVLASNSQFNGYVEFTAQDYAKLSNSMKGTKRLVVDNIPPTAQVTYNTSVQELEDTLYFDETIVATVAINEANFYAEDVEILITKDGGTPYNVTPTWSNNSADIHTGTISLTEDGDYTITINYTDKSQNKMETYHSENLVLDTVLEDPIITINGEDGDGKAYNSEVIPAVIFEDRNFEDYSITLTRTRFDEKDADVTEQFITGHISISETGGQGTFDVFEEIIENDGIYTLTVTMTDKAGHESSVVNVFTINRYGSVYEYSDYLAKLVTEGGAYVHGVTADLIITEYNADRLLADSLYIEITCDGKPLDNILYEITPEIGEETQIGDSGWFQYQYTISKDNFVSDGVYKISISSKDATGNTPENSNYEDKIIVFRVDNTVPEITSVVGLEKSIINAQEVEVKYNIYDTIGLKAVSVYVGGQLYGEMVTDFGDDINNYSGSFVLQETNSKQNVQIVVEDLAGNVVDTNSQTFTSAYAFNKSVTVSTNVLVRFAANKPLFFGSMGIVVAGVAAGGFFINVRRRKKLM